MELETILATIAQYYTQYITPYLIAEYQGETFQRFGLPHIIVLGTTFLLILVIIFSRGKLDDEGRASLREVMAQILIINEIISYLWLYFYQGIETEKLIYGISIKIMPFGLINIFAWLTAFMLLRKSKKLYELVYFIGIIAALYALFMPNLRMYGFPHYRFFYAFITPAIILIAAIHMTFDEEEMTPNWKSLLWVFITANIFIAIIYALNIYLGSNYLYLNIKPSLSFINLPDAPIHILYIEGVGIIISLLLFMPFLIIDWLRRRNLRADTTRIDKYLE